MVGGGFDVSPSRYSPVNLRSDVSYSAPNATNYLLELSRQALDTAVDKGTGSFWSVSSNIVYVAPGPCNPLPLLNKERSKGGAGRLRDQEDGA